MLVSDIMGFCTALPFVPKTDLFGAIKRPFGEKGPSSTGWACARCRLTLPSDLGLKV